MKSGQSNTNSYLPLTEYSSKYRVSISTLRRRIKSEEIRFVFEDGRYLLIDEPPSTHQGQHRPSPSQQSDQALMGDSQSPARPSEERLQLDEPVLTAANRLLSELKRAYTVILQEKEEQILHLKAEVADLKTLVRVLESDNDRMKKNRLT